MAKPQVTLTFAGDSTQLERTFDNVGSSARSMSSDVGASSSTIRDSGDAFDRAGEGADGAESKAQGFSDTLTGTKDLMGGVGEIARGNLFEGFVMAGQGVADLAGGMATFLIPAIKNFTASSLANAVQMVKTTATTTAHKVATLASTVATKAATVAQKALNLVLRANPIGLVITAIVALVAIFITAYKKSETFRNIVKGALDAVKNAATSLWNGIKSVMERIGRIASSTGRAVVNGFNGVVDFFRNLPRNIGSFFSNIGDVISRPFKAAFEAVKRFWNDNVGGKGFTVPSWIPGIGGKEFRIPRFHTGGIVPGAPGSESLALLQAGERVTPAGRAGAATVIELRSSGSRMDDLLLEILRRSIRVKGGNVQVVLGAS